MVKIVATLCLNSFFIPRWIPLLFFQVSDFFLRRSEDKIEIAKKPSSSSFSFSYEFPGPLTRRPPPSPVGFHRGKNWSLFDDMLWGIFWLEGKAHLLISKEKREKSVCRFRRRRGFVGGHFLNVSGRQMVKRDFLEDIDAEEKNCHFWWKCFEKLFQGSICLFVELYNFAG